MSRPTTRPLAVDAGRALIGGGDGLDLQAPRSKVARVPAGLGLRALR